MSEIISKPNNWPINNRELNLDVIYENVNRFLKDPNYVNKEYLFGSIDLTDMNQVNELGEIRMCDYEVTLLNTLYKIGENINCISLIVYLYGHIARFITVHKAIVNSLQLFGESISREIKEFNNLHYPLKLFYYCYSDYYFNKNRDFSDSIINTVKSVLNNTDDSKTIELLCFSYNKLLYDLGFANSNEIFPYLRFDREELKKLFELSAHINSKSKFFHYNDDTLKGIIKLSLRQWVMKSRNDYNTHYFYKFISVENSIKAFSNNEVWMSKAERLNDKREQKVIKEMFNSKKWIKYDWAKHTNIHSLDNCFVCSFSKTIPSEKMKKKYGSVVFGYKSDRIANILSPVINMDKHPFFDQVLFYDIIYDKNLAKSEINFLCDLINGYDFNDHEKGDFLEELLEYWYFSFKDKKWQDEAERRYQLFIDNNEEYFDLNIDDRFLKIKSSLYLFPDFIITTNNKILLQCKKRQMIKLSKTAKKSFLFCNNCLQADFSAINNTTQTKCSICGSEDTMILG